MPATLTDPHAPFLSALEEFDAEVASARVDLVVPSNPDEELDQQIARTERLLARLREQRHRRQVLCGAGVPPASDFRPDPHVDRSTSQEDEDPERFEDPSLRH